MSGMSKYQQQKTETVMRNGVKVDHGLPPDRVKIINAQTKQLKIVEARLDLAKKANNLKEVKRLTEMADNINGLIRRMSKTKGM